MRKLLLLLTALLTLGVSGAWAYVTTLEDGHLYTISFVSFDGNTTWGLSTSSTTASVTTANTTGSVFVAHSYTNAKGQSRWIFVNNADGNYLAYRAATTAFNISHPINEWEVGTLNTSLANVDNSANCTDKLYMIADKRAAGNNSLGCLTLRESNGSFDNSSAPYYKMSNGNYFTSALYFTESDANKSSAALLAIAKFDALYQVKDVLACASNITALFASPSSIEADINAAETAEAAATIATNYMKSAEGKKFYAVNSTATSLYMNVGTSQITDNSEQLTADAVMEVEYAGNGKYYLKGVNSGYYAGNPSSGRANPGTHVNKGDATPLYIGNTGSTNNVVYFAKAKQGGNTPEAIHYNSDYSLQGNVVAWAFDAGASQWNISPVTDEEYAALSEAVTEPLNFHLTDINGETYDGAYEGVVLSTIPTFEGCAGYTLTDQSWNFSTKTFSATVNFPFSISSNSKTNYVWMKSDFGNDNNVWCSADDEYVHKAALSSINSSNYTKFEWAITPYLEDGTFSFVITNHAKNLSMKNTTTEVTNKNASNTIILSDSPVKLMYVKSGSDYLWKLPAVNVYLSFYGESYNTMGIWNTVHGGSKVKFPEYTDYATLISNLTAACTAFMPYNSLIGSGLGKYSGTTAADMVTAYSNATGATSETATAEQLRTWTATLENPSSKLTLNKPVAPCFLHIRSIQGVKPYLKAADANNTMTFTTTKDKETIFLLAENGNLISYSKGLRSKDVKSTASADENPTYCTYVIEDAVNYELGKYSVTSIYKYGTDVKHYLYSTGENNSPADRNTYNAGNVNKNTFTIESAESLPVTFKGQFASFYSPVDLEIPDGVKVYTGTLNGDKLLLREITGTLPHATGVILEFEGYSAEATDAENTKEFNILSTSTDGTSDLLGSTAAQTVPENSTLVLGKNGENWGIYKYRGTTLGGFKAYMDMPDTPVKGFTFTFGDADAIANVLNGEENVNEVYDLSGRRVNVPARGLYIVNGKKVVIK